MQWFRINKRAHRRWQYDSDFKKRTQMGGLLVQQVQHLMMGFLICFEKKKYDFTEFSHYMG